MSGHTPFGQIPHKSAVQGYMFRTVAESGELAEQNENICQIVRRANSEEFSDQQALDLGPAFLVEFGDGSQEVVYAMELHPWYSVD